MARLSCSLALLCLYGVLLTMGVWAQPCNLTLSSLDLHSVLQWDCPGLPPNTRYTVQTMKVSQGMWQDVEGCSNVSTSFCDLSPAFSKTDQLYFTRIRGVWAGGDTDWTQSPLQFHPERDTALSPPILSVSVQGEAVSVSVTLRCSPYQRKRRSKCLSVPSVLSTTTISISLYRDEPSPVVLKTVSLRKPWKYTFKDLLPGQRYCVIVSISTYKHSSSTAPHCVSIAGTVPAWLKLTAVLSALLLAVFVAAVFLKMRLPKAPLPRPLEMLHEGFPGGLCPGVEGGEEQWDRLSILSLSMSHCSPTQCQLAPATLTHENPTYHSNGIPQDSRDSEGYWVGGGSLGAPEESSCGPDYSPTLPQCMLAFSSGLYSTAVAFETPCPSQTDGTVEAEMPQAASRPLLCGGGDQDIPLHTVRLRAGAEADWQSNDWSPLVQLPLGLGSGVWPMVRDTEVQGADDRSPLSKIEDSDLGDQKAFPTSLFCHQILSSEKALCHPGHTPDSPPISRNLYHACPPEVPPLTFTWTVQNREIEDSSGSLPGNAACETWPPQGTLSLNSLLHWSPNTGASESIDSPEHWSTTDMYRVDSGGQVNTDEEKL
ncbi:interferon alpha/beta receptor 1b [Amia ocellicauda]|uniref:interferon alpha/beta receptor 1b n=1 Tax=Amia ocellicauda TaxID=2972642 RepID=UPI003464DFC6